MSDRPLSVEPYLRGSAWPSGAGVPYPRADPDDFARLPIDTWSTAQLPVSVRLELVGDAGAVELEYHTGTDDLGYRGDGAGRTFTVFRGGQPVDEQPAMLGQGTVRLSLRADAPDDRAIVYLPEGMKPVVESIVGVDGNIAPAPPQPRWLCYGDSIAEGWVASGPAHAWPALAGRQQLLDVVNLGYAGSARGEIVSAEQISPLPGDVISLTHGTNCWTRIPFSEGMMREQMRAFIAIVRQGHPDTPIVVGSPVIRPDAEDTPNRLGATLRDLRGAIEAVAHERIAGGDSRLTLVPCGDLLRAEHLADGVHPGNEGHSIMGAHLGAAVRAALDGAS